MEDKSLNVSILAKKALLVLGDLMLNTEISPEVRFQAAELLTRLDREARSEAMAREAQEKFGAGQFPPPPPFG